MSSTSPTSTLPSPAELENLAVIFVGFVVATVLYGFTFFQSYIYYSRYPYDSRSLKYLVAVLCALDTVASAIVSQVLYYYLVIMFDVNMEILYASTTFCIQYVISTVLTFISQMFFVHRVCTVTGKPGLVTMTVTLFSFTSLVFGLTSAGQMFAQRQLSAMASPSMQAIAALNQSFSAMTDLIIFTTMCYSLRPKNFPDMLLPKGAVEIAITLLVNRGLASALTQLALLCVFVACPSKQLWVPLQMTACKIHVNTVLGSLNSRPVKQGYGVYEEDTTTRTDAPSEQGLPSAIHFKTNTRVTQQSTNFTSTSGDVESRVSEVEESRKAESGQFESLQVASQSHMDLIVKP